MRLLVTLLLLVIQLRPVAGAAVCLEQAMADQECAMPEHGDGVTEPSGDEQSVPASCLATALCTPAGVAVSHSAVTLELTRTAVGFVPALKPAQHRSPPLAPPFHPPRP